MSLRPEPRRPRSLAGRRGLSVVAALAVAVVALPLAAAAQADRPAAGGAAAQLAAERAALADDPAASHRLIVQLAEPSLAEWADAGAVPRAVAYDAEGLLDDDTPAARAQLARIDAQQRTFLAQLPKQIPGARLATYLDAYRRAQPLQTRIVLNAVVVEAGRDADLDALEAALRGLPGVKAVGRDTANQPHMYDSLGVINAAAAWDDAAVGGVANAGAGIRAASMDGGVHKDAPMFAGNGYLMPIGYPIGYVENTNGKIIASRVYFRSWDPPAPTDDTSWPGAFGTSHGVHTAGTMAGNRIEATYPGAETPVTVSGVAPRAYVMSYRVFYSSVNGIGSFYNAEGIQALEDIVRDRAHVLNNSWGGGPGSQGGLFDALDTALVNATRAGIFVSMSNGNAGPGPGTGDHPSANYINVAASTKGSVYVAGGVDVTAPAPVTTTLVGMAYDTADFGGTLPIGQKVGPFNWLPAGVVSATNAIGCAPFPAGAFAGKAALIERGVCNFSLKAAHAQDAGATLAIIYNHTAGGNAPFGMAAGDRAGEVTIPTISVGRADGLALIDWQAQHGAAAQLVIDTVAHLWRNSEHPEVTPADRIAGFSSRGPSSSGTLKPDIAAPGVDIMSQGYAPGGGEGRHLGFGQVGGTSMASPHVAGAATMLRQIHRDWTPAMIKSALMSTSKYLDVWVGDRPAQPLDMGAGRLDLTHAADPGVILQPPSLSFGWQPAGTSQSIKITLASVASGDETYRVTTVDTRGGFTNPPPVAGMTVDPATVTVPAGGTASLTITWNNDGLPIGDAQGFVVLTGEKYHAHLPAWMRVTPAPAAAEVLVIDVDGSRPGSAAPVDYTPVYTATLAAMGVPYAVHDASAAPASPRVPTAAELKAYKWLLIQTGDNRNTPTLSTLDQNHLMEYVASGGWVVVFGQNAAQVMGSNSPDGGSSFYGTGLGATWQKDSVNATGVFTDTEQVLAGAPGSPFNNVSVDVSAVGDGAGNQTSIDEIKFDAEIGALPLLRYSVGGGIVERGFVAGAWRNDPTVDRPGRWYLGRAVYFGFGLEGVNDDTGHTGREDLLKAARTWLMEEPTLTVGADVKPAHRQSYFNVALQSPAGDTGVRYRATFGDGTGVFETTELQNVEGATIMGHVWTRPGRYHVVIEGRGAMGVTTVWEQAVDVVAGPTFHDWDPIYLPVVLKGEVWK